MCIFCANELINYSIKKNAMMNLRLFSVILFILQFSYSAIGQDGPSKLGYLYSHQLPNSALILSPPPDTGSVAFALDQYLATEVFSRASYKRQMQAISDASTDLANNQPFDTIIGITIDSINTPILMNLCINGSLDAYYSTVAAKDKYERTRPFVYNRWYTCTPELDEGLSKDGSYPSGHSAYGWAYALILSEIFPDKTTELLVRGKQFGISRNVCNAHWHSDVEAGRTMGSSTVARLHADPVFRADIEKAKKEVARYMKKKY